MQSSLKKSLYLGLAALSFASVAAVSTTASAKSAVKVTSDKVLTTDATTRNVNLTGTNAIYSKPGTVKGAKVIATTTTAKNLNKSTTSHENFRAYRVAKTNRGSYYYKVVSYNKAYRGWVYGGKTADTFAGGVTSYNTFKEGTLTDVQKSTTYKITNPGKTAAGLTYKQPAWTQYKIGKTMADTTAYKDASFNITAVGTRTREGDTWVKIANTNTADTKADGWILQSNLSVADPIADNAVRINLIASDGSKITHVDYAKSGATKGSNLGTLSQTSDGVYAWNLATSDVTPIQTKINDALNGTGYTLANNTLTASQQAILAQGKFGSTVDLVLSKGNTVYTQFNANSRDVNAVSNKADKMTVLGTTNAVNGTGLKTVSAVTDSTKVAAPLDDLSVLYGSDATTTKALTDAVKALEPADLTAYNKNIALSAAQLYVAPSNLKITDLFSGAEGAAFTKAQALAYLNGNKELSNLKSAVYPQFNADGTYTWKQLTYAPADADAGTFGKVSNAVFTYDLSKAATTTMPTTTNNGGTDTTSPLA